MNRQQLFTAFFFATLVFLLFQLYSILVMFLKPLTWTVILVLTFYPTYTMLLRFLPERRGTAAASEAHPATGVTDEPSATGPQRLSAHRAGSVLGGLDEPLAGLFPGDHSAVELQHVRVAEPNECSGCLDAHPAAPAVDQDPGILRRGQL